VSRSPGSTFAARPVVNANHVGLLHVALTQTYRGELTIVNHVGFENVSPIARDGLPGPLALVAYPRIV
jgi:hypothetical protein